MLDSPKFVFPVNDIAREAVRRFREKTLSPQPGREIRIALRDMADVLARRKRDHSDAARLRKTYGILDVDLYRVIDKTALGDVKNIIDGLTNG